MKGRNALWKKTGCDPDGKLVSALRTAGTFLLVSFAWIFFRADTLGDAFLAIQKIFTDYSFTSAYFTGSMQTLGLTLGFALFAAFAVALLFGLERVKRLPEFLPNGAGIYRSQKVRFALYLALSWCVIAVWIYLQAAEVGSSFIYFQF